MDVTMFYSIRVAFGQLVLSGILSEQADEVQWAYELWFCFSTSAEQEGWVRLHAVRMLR